MRRTAAGTLSPVDPAPPPTIMHATFSNAHPMVDVVADGVNVLSTAITPGLAPQFQVASGTSIAAAHVAGCAALLMGKMALRTGEPMRGDSLVAALLTSTVDILDLGRDAQSGAGFLTFYPELLQPVSVGGGGGHAPAVSAERPRLTCGGQAPTVSRTSRGGA